VVCLLIRSAPRVKSQVAVFVHVPGKGYAADAGSVLELPSVTFGFDVEALAPVWGSRMGGTQLMVHGYGFSVGNPLAHSVLLTKTNKEVDPREQMLMDLGLFSGLAAETMACVPSHVTWTELFCEIPLQEGLYGNPEGNYTLAVTLNDLPATCMSPDSGEDCLFIQDNTHTPMIYNSTVTHVDVVSGSMDIELIGGLLFADIPLDDFDVNLEEAGIFCHCSCEVLAVQDGPTSNTTRLLVRAPSVAQGNWTLHVHVRGYGFTAMTAAAKYIQAGIYVHNVTIHGDNAGGSLGGNNTATVNGYGFNPDCDMNTLTLTVVGHSAVEVTEDLLMSCSETAVTFHMPSMAGHVVDHHGQTLSTATDLVVTHLTADTLGGGDDAVSHTGVFAYTYSSGLTPEVTVAVSPSSGFAHDVMTATVQIPGAAVDVDLTRMTMDVGDRRCMHMSYVQTGQSVELTCTVPALPGDVSYPVKVSVFPLGLAVLHSVVLPSFYSSFEVTNNVPYGVQSSIAGGSMFEVTGRGLSAHTSVTVCGEECTHVDNAYDKVTCKSPDRRTITSVEYYESIGANMELKDDLAGDLFTSWNNNEDLIFDGSYQTYYYHSSSSCYVGLELPSGFKAQPYRLRFYPRLQNAYRFGSTVFEGSKDGGASYEVLDTLTRADEGWNFFEADEESQEEWFTHFRFRNNDGVQNSKCMMAEIRFVGVMAAVEDSCDVQVAGAAGLTAHTVGSVTYDASATPYIHSIEPNNGTALGGTEVTLQGLNLLHPDRLHDAPFVYLSGVPCTVTNFSSTEIICVSGERTLVDLNASDDDALTMHGDHDMAEGSGSHSHSHEHRRHLDAAHSHHDETNPNHGDTHAHIVGLGDCVHGYDATYMYIDRWSDLTSWRNHEPPVDKDMVWIPEGQVVLLDIDTPLLAFLLVEGKLYFDPHRDVNLDAYSVVINGGHFQLGTEDEPYTKKANLTIWGDRYTSIEIPHVGTKGIVVGARGMAHNHGGSHDGEHVVYGDVATLQIYGEKRLRTWTHVNETAHAGQNSRRRTRDRTIS